MNRAQKVVLTLGAVVAIAMGLIPPWSHTFDFQSTSQSKPAGYSLILSPPQPERKSPYFGVRLDSSRLVLQWVVVAIATGVGLALLHRRENSQSADPGDKQ